MHRLLVYRPNPFESREMMDASRELLQGIPLPGMGAPDEREGEVRMCPMMEWLV
jgi:hypothetical protein